LKEEQRDYLYGGAFAKERTRLASIEALWDPGSQSLLDEVGLGAGRRRIEVGAGGGSLVEWMVKRGAAVTAMDIDTRFIEHLASDTVDVRCVDVRTDELPLGKFDPVHARLVLEHLSDRRNILDKLAATLRPRGWIVIEDYQFSCFSVGDEPYLEATVPADAEPFEVAWQIVKVVDAAKGSRPFRTTSIVPDLHRSGRQRRRRRHPRGRTSMSCFYQRIGLSDLLSVSSSAPPKETR
jgi:SAM-dependent methyltransferase